MRRQKEVEIRTHYSGFFDHKSKVMQDDAGRQHEVHFVEIKKPVAVLLYHIERKAFVLIHQQRPALAKSPIIIEIVAGLVDGKHEAADTRMAARREALEETGFEPDELTEIGSFYLSPGYSSEEIDIFYAEVDDSARKGEGGGLDKESENVEVFYLSPAEARMMIEEGHIKDAKTVIALQWWQRKFIRP